LVVAAILLAGGSAVAQSNAAAQRAELEGLVDKVGHPDTRIRVDAFHKVWTIAMESEDSGVKLLALELMGEPVGSASDHIRMPAVYAIAEVANSTSDLQVKLKALATLREPMQASQLPIRSAAIDAINSIVRSARNDEVVSSALSLLGGPVRSANNGVRIPASNAIMKAAEHGSSERIYNQALDLLVAPLDSAAAIGGMEVRLMAVVAVERIGATASDIATKSKAMGLLQSYASKGSWEPEAKRRAQEAAARIQNSMKQRSVGPRQGADLRAISSSTPRGLIRQSRQRGA
jgi:hypothetical protein